MPKIRNRSSRSIEFRVSLTEQHSPYPLLLIMAVLEEEQAQIKTAELNFRPPHTTAAGAYDPQFRAPALDFLSGAWNVTHSTLPMWKKNKNVKITYASLRAPVGALDDLVEYNPIDGDKQKTVRGVDTPDSTRHAAYNWRGKGLLMIASSHWEILGYGDEDGGWMVTYFSKTMFTPAGVDVYARRKGGLSEQMLQRIRSEMKGVDDSDFQRLVDEMFAVKHEWR
jgi:hypothetical protein